MTAKKTAAATHRGEEDPKLEMSPMIDLVFLLLIFFMVSSHLIIVQIDKNVRPPIAEEGQPPNSSDGRIVVNIYEDGRIFGPNQQQLATMGDISAYVEEARIRNDTAGLRSRLHIRADKFTDTGNIKRVVKAASDVRVKDVIFSAFKVDRN